MRHQVLQMIGERLALFCGLSGADAERQGDITQEALAVLRRRKRQDIGWLVLAAKPTIEITNRLIIRQEQRDALPKRTLRSQGRLRSFRRQGFYVGQHSRPGLVFKVDVRQFDRPASILAASAS